MTFKECREFISEDLEMFPYKGKLGGARYFLSNASFKLTVWLRIGQYLRTKKNFIARLCYGIVFLIHKHNQYLTGIQIRLETCVGGGLRFQHFSNIVINEGCKIGHHVLIFQGVTIGFGTDGNPTIGNNVVICSGAKVIGGIHIGDNVIIGANAVVTHDIPDGAVVVGIPAKVISMTAKGKISNYMCH